MTELELKLITLLETSQPLQGDLERQQEQSLKAYQNLVAAYKKNRQETAELRQHCAELSQSVSTLNDQLQRLMRELPR